jgi:hypothetical protein
MPKYSIMPKGSGLFPVDRQRVLQRISTNSIDDQGEAVQQPQAQPGPSTDYSPRQLLIREITKVISPEGTADTEAAKKNQAQRRKRVQAKCGEVLTEAECMERLRQDEESKKAKGAGAKGAGAKGKKGKSGVVKSSLKQKPKPGVKEKSLNQWMSLLQSHWLNLFIAQSNPIPSLKLKSFDQESLVGN